MERDTENTAGDASSSGGWFAGGQKLSRRTSSRDIAEDRKNRPLHTRKVPVKVEPKVFFANERTFLAWLHMALTLASISVGIVSFSTDDTSSRLYGLTMMPVSIAFCGYALMTYMRVSIFRYLETRYPPITRSKLMFALYCILLYCSGRI